MHIAHFDCLSTSNMCGSLINDIPTRQMPSNLFIIFRNIQINLRSIDHNKEQEKVTKYLIKSTDMHDFNN